MARIILADDDAAMRDMVKRALASEGHLVIAEQDGQDALDRILADPKAFDLLLSDVQMPGLDGISLTAQAIAANAGLRVVLMSAYADSVSIPASLKGHIKAMLTKPLTLDQIRQAVKTALA